jgi:hypothetical protein
MYRIRPSFSEAPYLPLPSAFFAASLGPVDPNRTRWRPLPIPASAASVDFVDGLVTLGGAGDPTAGPGYAVHLYAANASMSDRSFSDADGDLLIVPQTGTRPSQIACHLRVGGGVRVAGNTVEAGRLARRRAAAGGEAHQARPSRGAIERRPARLQALLAERAAPRIRAAVRRHLEIEAREAGVAIAVL